jgi:hypothetical protein
MPCPAALFLSPLRKLGSMNEDGKRRHYQRVDEVGPQASGSARTLTIKMAN